MSQFEITVAFRKRIILHWSNRIFNQLYPTTSLWMSEWLSKHLFWHVWSKKLTNSSKHNQYSKFFQNLVFSLFWWKITHRSNSDGSFRTNFDLNSWLILDPKVLKEAFWITFIDWRVDYEKIGYFDAMKYFGFILVLCLKLS